MVNRTDLAGFLRTRREKLQPGDVGLPGGQRRRTPGLRRQEVAELAGLSVDYYIRLEQGRGPRPSRQVLTALARALMLNTDEREYLFRVAGEAPWPMPGPASGVATEIQYLLDAMPLTPAYVVSARYDILAWNRLAVHFVGDLSGLAPGDRNMIRWMFRQPPDDAHWSDADALAFARSTVAGLRAAYAKYPGSPAMAELVAELLEVSPNFAGMWAERDVAERHPMRKHVDHPAAGPLDFSCQVLHVADTDQRMIVYVAEPGSATASAFERLAARPAPSAYAVT